jgi:hypothetical protein
MNDPQLPADPQSGAPDDEPLAHVDDASMDDSSTGETSMDDASQLDMRDPDVPQPGPATAEPALLEPVPHAGARYALLRLLMLVAVGGILYVIGMRGWLLAFTAVLVSGIVSLFLLMKQRNDAAVNLERTVDGWKHRRDHEDAGLAPQ